METYARLPVAFEHGEGAWLWDDQGRRYLDALAGIAVCGLGHANPRVSEAIAQQARRLVHTSNLYRIPIQERLAARLASLAAMDGVFLCNSGAEANEAAIKIARAHASAGGIENPEIVVAEGSFHGRTLATLSATGNRRVHAGFEPLVQGFVRAPYGDAAALGAVLEARPRVVAVLLEPVLGEGGVVIPPRGYLARLRELCDASGALLMIDEVQTGLGRTGAWFAHQHEGIRPDVMTLAKALGNGVPIGACLASGAAATALRPGMHGSTFGGNPLACAAALAVLDEIEERQLWRAARERGAAIQEILERELAGVNAVVEIRSSGLMIGVELSAPCTELVALALERGLLINVTAGNVVRLLPPLVIDEAEAGEIGSTLAAVIRDWSAGAGGSR